MSLTKEELVKKLNKEQLRFEFELKNAKEKVQSQKRKTHKWKKECKVLNEKINFLENQLDLEKSENIIKDNNIQLQIESQEKFEEHCKELQLENDKKSYKIQLLNEKINSLENQLTESVTDYAHYEETLEEETKNGNWKRQKVTVRLNILKTL